MPRISQAAQGWVGAATIPCTQPQLGIVVVCGGLAVRSTCMTKTADCCLQSLYHGSGLNERGSTQHIVGAVQVLDGCI